MNKITCIVIDDEPLALELMVSYIIKTPTLELKGKFDNPIDAMEFLEVNSIQLVFLDIHMPDLTGVEFARSLKSEAKVIFTTAYDKYAVEGFKLHALDYLLKPISYEVFIGSVMHAKEHFSLLDTAASSSGKAIEMDEDFLFIKADYQIKRIHYSEIQYFEGLKDYVKLYVEGRANPIVFHASLKSIEAKLPKNMFMRIHRSYIVALSKVKTIERDRILFGSVRIPISKQYKPEFDQFIQNKFL